MLSKKIISFTASALIVFYAACPALAASTPRSTKESSPIHVDYVYINRASSTLSISNGTAHIFGYVQRTTSGKRIYVESTLESYSGGSWNEVASWSASSSSYSASVSKTYRVSGGTYRVATYYSVSGSSGSESDTLYSKTVSC
ncbi:hypothetical protein CAFE_30500 [Caprobacter fermentans]|uniref:Uncharacterized protein n=1 Tax=Caproicibacter fermentans TaxID=2576756 RepID=A0A6N8I3J7_9FIRM|nr:hypothetical protein [Caproicibacter fermentans]